ncbi:MAG: hypothetical protein ACYDH6_12205 [Acidimicrobiales bacterium]
MSTGLVEAGSAGGHTDVGGPDDDRVVVVLALHATAQTTAIETARA